VISDNGSYDYYRKYIEGLPSIFSPEIFRLHSNTENDSLPRLRNPFGDVSYSPIQSYQNEKQSLDLKKAISGEISIHES
jgi:hypothetical protein